MRMFYSRVRAATAMAVAPSTVLWPPMKPPACTKMPPGWPVTPSSSASRSPRHSAGSERRFSKLPGVTLTHWMRQLPLSSCRVRGHVRQSLSVSSRSGFLETPRTVRTVRV